MTDTRYLTSASVKINEKGILCKIIQAMIITVTHPLFKAL